MCNNTVIKPTGTFYPKKTAPLPVEGHTLIEGKREMDPYRFREDIPFDANILKPADLFMRFPSLASVTPIRWLCDVKWHDS